VPVVLSELELVESVERDAGEQLIERRRVQLSTGLRGRVTSLNPASLLLLLLLLLMLLGLETCLLGRDESELVFQSS